MTTCIATRKDGSPCKAVAQSGSRFCFFHDPEKAAERHESKVKGGKAGKLATLPAVKPWRGQAGEVVVLTAVTPAELENLLCETIDDVRTGAIDPKVANAVGYLVGSIVKVKEVMLIEDRLAAIEAAIGDRER